MGITAKMSQWKRLGVIVRASLAGNFDKVLQIELQPAAENL